MKQIKATTNLNFESDEHLSSAVNGNKLFYSSPRHHHSTASLNTISSNGHDFELRRRDLPHADHSNKRLRFFHKRKSKDLAAKLVPQPSSFYEDPLSSSSTTTPTRPKNSSQFFGQSLALLIQRYNQQIPPVLQVRFFSSTIDKSKIFIFHSCSNCSKFFITKAQRWRAFFEKSPTLDQ